jgi:hypothetical protein
VTPTTSEFSPSHVNCPIRPVDASDSFQLWFNISFKLQIFNYFINFLFYFLQLNVLIIILIIKIKEKRGIRRENGSSWKSTTRNETTGAKKREVLVLSDDHDDFAIDKL